MFKRFTIKITKCIAVPFMLLTTLLSCSSDQDVTMVGDNEPIQFKVADDDEGFTRGAYQTAKQFTDYAVYSFMPMTQRMYVGNIVMKKQEDESWTSSRTISFPGKNALDFFALKPGFVRSDVQNLTMTYDEKSFVHTLPNTNAKQTDFMISSLFDKTKEATGGILLFKFKHIFAYLRFVGKCSVTDLNVKVRSITLHNIKSTGKFTFSNTVERDGAWEMAEDLDNYQYLLPEERDLTAKQALLHTTDSMLFVMPQSPTIFAISENASFADADVAGNEKAYLEVECRLWKMREDDNNPGNQIPDYIGCTATTWAKVYFPLAATTKWQTASAPYSGTYNVMLDFTGGYDYDGQDFLEKHTGGVMKMVSLESIESVLVTDPWVEDNENSATLNMR